MLANCHACESEMIVNIALSSPATFLGHVPWLGVYMGKVPAAADQLQKLMAYCRTRAQKRLERSPVLKKDLFHYLVCDIFCVREWSPRITLIYGIELRG